MWFPYVNPKVYWFIEGSPNPLFYRCKFSPRLLLRLLFRKTRTKLAGTERYWRLPSPPIVGDKHVVSLCKSKSVLIYARIAKSFILPVQIFATIAFKITFSQNSNETRRHWGILAAPVAANSGRKTYDFLMVVVVSEDDDEDDDGSRRVRGWWWGRGW